MASIDIACVGPAVMPDPAFVCRAALVRRAACVRQARALTRHPVNEQSAAC
jgi:hypothetical protein